MTNTKKDVFLFFISKVIVAILDLILVSMYSSFVSPDIYGEYSLISSLISALISIFIGWISSSALRYYIDYEKDKKTFYSNVLIYSFAMISIIILFIYIYSLFFNKIPIKKYLFPIIFYVFVLSMTEIFEKILRASQKTKTYVVGVIIQSLLSILLFYTLFSFFEKNANIFFLSNSFSKFIFLLIILSSLSLFKNLGHFKLNKSCLKKFLSYGIPMIGVWGISWLLSYCDRYIIAIYYNTQSVGLYDMSYKLSENTINIIISAFTLAIFPSLIRIWKNKGQKEVENKITEVLQYYFLITIPAVIGLSLISEKIYLGIIDKQYISGQYIIIIVSIGMFFNGLNSIFNKIWQLNENTKKILYIMIISVLLNIILNIIFIPKYGIIVASITTLISYLISTLITFILVKKEFKIIINNKGLLKTIFSTIIMAIFLLIFNKYVNNIFMLFVEIIIAVIIYGIMSLLTKNISIKYLKVK